MRYAKLTALTAMLLFSVVVSVLLIKITAS
jgi:hypothetical protein